MSVKIHKWINYTNMTDIKLLRHSGILIHSKRQRQDRHSCMKQIDVHLKKKKEHIITVPALAQTVGLSWKHGDLLRCSGSWDMSRYMHLRHLRLMRTFKDTVFGWLSCNLMHLLYLAGHWQSSTHRTSRRGLGCRSSWRQVSPPCLQSSRAEATGWDTWVGSQNKPGVISKEGRSE